MTAAAAPPRLYLYPLELILPELGLTLYPGHHRTHPFLTNPATAALFYVPHNHATASQTPPSIPRLVRGRILETLTLCHDWRDMLWRQALPCPLFWQQVGMHAHWSRKVNWMHLRDLVLSVVQQIAVVHVARRPRWHEEEGKDVRKMTTISIAALRAARDMELYERDRREKGTKGYVLSSYVRFQGEWAMDGFVRARTVRRMEAGLQGDDRRMTQEEVEWLGVLFATGDEEGLWWWIKGLGVRGEVRRGSESGSETGSSETRRSSWLGTVLDSDSAD